MDRIFKFSWDVVLMIRIHQSSRKVLRGINKALISPKIFPYVVVIKISQKGWEKGRKGGRGEEGNEERKKEIKKKWEKEVERILKIHL